MARFWINGSGSWSDSSHWSTSSGGASGASVPDATQDVTFDSNSGTAATCTVDVAAHANSITINKSDFTLLDNSGMTVVGTVTLTTGALNTNGQAESWKNFQSSSTNTRTITLGASQITLTGSNSTDVWDIGVPTGLTFSAGTSIITATGSGVFFFGGTGAAGTPLFNSVVFTGGSMNLKGLTTVNLSITGTVSKGNIIQMFQADSTITGSLIIMGNNAINRMLVSTDVSGTQRALIVTGATVNCNNVDFMDIKFVTSSSSTLDLTNGGANSVGDCGNNTLTHGFSTGVLTLTPSVTQTWSGTSGGNWSTNAWTTRVPLPQDDVIINAAFSSSQTVAADMPRLGRSINFTGATGTPAWSLNSLFNTMFGSLTLVSGMTLSAINNSFTGITFAGNGNYSINTAGQSLGVGMTIASRNGAYTLLANTTTAKALTLINGDLEMNGFNLSCLSCTNNSGLTRVLNISSGNLVLTGTGIIWNSSNNSGLTMIASSGSIVATDTTSATKTLSFTTNNVIPGVVTPNNSVGAYLFNSGGTYTITKMALGTGTTHTFQASRTVILGSSPVMSGSPGNVITINSGTPGIAAIFSSPTYMVSGSYLNITDNNPLQTGKFFCGSNSTLVSNTGNWMTGTGYYSSQSAGITFSGAEPKQVDVLLQAGH